jgi:hypothetical protein
MATTSERERSPLKYIPSADAVRRRLETVLTEARKLRILLKTASEIELADSFPIGESDQPREGFNRE